MANEEAPTQEEIKLWLTELESAVKTLKGIAEHLENLVERGGITHPHGPVCHGGTGVKLREGKRGGRSGRKRSDKGVSQ